MVTILTNSLVPIFVGLLLRYSTGLRKIVNNKDVEGLISFLMTFASTVRGYSRLRAGSLFSIA